jgi:hypothetical protein
MVLHEAQQKMKAEERASASPFRHSVFVTDYFIAEIYQVIMRIGQMRWGKTPPRGTTRSSGVTCDFVKGRQYATTAA